MALITCPECNKEISNMATACPRCGCPIAQLEENPESVNIAKTNEDINNSGSPDRPKRNNGCLITIAAIFALIVLIVIVSVVSGGDSEGNDNVAAITYAQIAVKEQLKSPSTAEFPNLREFTVTNSGNTYTVSSYVDSQNSFGATVRTNFVVIVEIVSSNSYKILSVSFD